MSAAARGSLRGQLGGAAPGATPGGAGAAGGPAAVPTARRGVPACSRAGAAGGSYVRRLAARVAICVALAMLLPGPSRDPGGAFVGAPGSSPAPRLRGAPTARRAEEEPAAAGAAAGGDDEAAALRAKVAALEQRLASSEAVASVASAQLQQGGWVQPKTKAAPEVEALWAKISEELEAELADIEDAKMGMDDNKQYVFSQTDASAGNPIYKRKYEVLGMTITQQDTYMKSFKKALRKAKSLESVKRLDKLWKEGGDGFTRKDVREECTRLRTGSIKAAVFMRDILPEVVENPYESAITSLVVLVGFILLVALFFVCLLPPTVQLED